MNGLSKYLTEQILLGEEENNIKRTIVIYSGRFQPFHRGHYATYSLLVKKFGKNNVFIGTSNKTELPKSPFNFKEKKKIMQTMFGIPSSQIVQIKNPYRPTEILSKFDEESTAYVTVVGEKDANRLGGKYFQKWDGEATEGYRDRGYVFISPKQSNAISGTDVRNGLGNGSEEEKKEFFTKRAYPKFNKGIFDLITGKLNESFVISKETIEEWLTNSTLLRENSATTSGQDDDGPTFMFPNYDIFNLVSARRAKKIGYEVVNMIMTKELEDYYEHPTYPKGPAQAVSYFPAGVLGAKTPNNQFDIYSNKAYDKWYKHMTRKATLAGYELVFTQIERELHKKMKSMSGIDAKGDSKFKNKMNSQLSEAITLPVEIGDTILTGRFKNKKTVVKSIGKDEYGMPTINGRKVVTFRIVNESYHADFLDEKYILGDLEKKYGINLELYDNGDYLTLSKIIVPKEKHGEGIGSKVMQDIISYSEKVQKPIYLTPSTDFGGSSKSRLEKFYKKFGFIKKPKSDFSARETMVRYNENVLFENVLTHFKNLGIPRTKMPQIHEEDLPKFRKYLDRLGIKHRDQKIPLEDLKFTQKELSIDKVKAFKGKKFNNDKYIITSKDNYILDGHHRVLAKYMYKIGDTINAIKVDLPIKKLLEVCHNFSEVDYKDSVHEIILPINEATDKLKLKIPSDIIKIHKAFKKAGKKLYVVGGAVRDAILGKNPKDFDLATDAKPDEVLDIAKKAGFNTAEVGKAFGVVLVGGHEIATFRKDIGKGRRPDAVDYTDIEGDVKRRDLTVNALFYDIDRGEIVDLVGGIEDLKKNRIRTVGKAEDRFDEDPLRKLRALRFQARLGGSMDPAVMTALKNDPTLTGVSSERIRDEFLKTIKSAKSTKKYMELLDKLGFTKFILPGIKVSKPYPDNNNPNIFLAAILSDNDVSTLGKKLNKLNYTAEEIKNIVFLISLKDFNPDDVVSYKKAQSRTTLSDAEILRYGMGLGKNLKKFVDFNLSVSGNDAPEELKGKEIGNWINKMEKEKFLNEMAKSELDKIEKFADSKLSPEDVEFTKHFFDRLNDPRNEKDINVAELTGFFKRLARHKKQLVDFLEKYNQIVVKDKRSNINIPFVKTTNQIIAKTIMRKSDFKTKNPVLAFEDKVSGGLADNMSLKDIAKKHNVPLEQIVSEFKKGYKVEREHTDDIDLAKEIAMDHLVEMPDYYTKLATIEETIKQVDGKWVVYPKNGGKRLGTHDTKEKAVAQLRAIEISKNENINENKEKELKLLKLYNKALKMMPNSPAQLKIRKEIEKLQKELGIRKELNESPSISLLKKLDKDIGWVGSSITPDEVANFVAQYIKGSNAVVSAIAKAYVQFLKKKIKKNDMEQFINDLQKSYKFKIKENLISEGGAYGHMSHPFDTDINLTFGQLKDIVKRALNGELELAREKTDGQALAVTWKNGKLLAARNKGHLKNKAENALDAKGVATKFKGRGELEKAYNFAMNDLSNAIKALSDKQREKIFQDGASFMNLEVIYPTSVNVIPYGQALLVFHGTMQYDMDGNAIGENQEAGRILAGMIKQVNKDVQDKYTIQGPPVIELPKSQKLSSKQSKYNKQISALQKEFKLRDSDGVGEYHQAWWDNWIDKNAPTKVPADVKKGLIQRWAFFDKKFRLDKKSITDETLLNWAQRIDKEEHKNIAKKNLMKFEEIFLGLGAEVLQFVDSVLAVNPDKAIRDMKKRLNQTIKDVNKKGDEKQVEKLKLELERLQSLGGADKIVPNEGIVFQYNGQTFKLTGAFAPLNQLLGIFY